MGKKSVLQVSINPAQLEWLDLWTSSSCGEVVNSGHPGSQITGWPNAETLFQKS
jgi:hypothetical protein